MIDGYIVCADWKVRLLEEQIKKETPVYFCRNCGATATLAERRKDPRWRAADHVCKVTAEWQQKINTAG